MRGLVQNLPAMCVFRVCARVIPNKMRNFTTQCPLAKDEFCEWHCNEESKIMKISRLVTMVAAMAVAVMATACTLLSSAPTLPNEATFDIGETVASTVKYQFLSITSEREWSIGIEYLTPEDESDWCSLGKSSGVGSDNVMMTFGENTLGEARSLRLSVTFSTFPAEVVELTFTQLASGGGEFDPQTLPKWLELPAFEADGSQLYFSKHMLPSSGNAKRSFSLLYDSDIYHSYWVAYPLYRDVIGSGNRTNDWGIFDPNIPQEKQLYMKNSYQGSYDRGHMLPSASRAKSTSDNSPTFYPTNMSPQMSGLNQQKWAGIEEGQVRGWANGCDTLYVVTGAVFQTVGGNEEVGFTYCRSDSSKSVAIPNYYYKALLQRRGTGTNSTYQALAIWVSHKAATGVATLDDVITIDQLEERTGIDFFANLEESVQSRVEASFSNQFWGL